MSNKINDGGPAFPATELWDSKTQEFTAPATHGMSLRDYLAAHAPAVPATWRAQNNEATNIIAWRWAYADAMLEARNQ